MAYLTIKKVKGHYYGYMQESYREGGRVHTRTVEYLGAMEPAVAKQVQATRKQLGQADMAALVQSVREASTAATRAPENPTQPKEAQTPPEAAPEPARRYKRMTVNGRPQLVDTKTGELIEPQEKEVITTKNAKPTLRPFADSLKLPADIQTHRLNRTSLHATHRKFGERLKALEINPATMPDVVIKYGKVHYMTKHGAEELASMYKLPVDLLRFPTGQVQFGERMAKHRFAQVDFHIGLRMWAGTRGAQVGLSDMDFDVSGSRRGGNFEPLTSIELPNEDRPVIADGIFSVCLNDTPLLYALEIHRTTQTKAVAAQIKRYMDVLESGALSFKYGVQFPAVVCSVHTLDNVLRGVKKHLMATPYFAAFKHLFLFNTTEQLAEDFSEGWEFADGTPADPFPKATAPLPVQLLDEPILPEGI